MNKKLNMNNVNISWKIAIGFVIILMLSTATCLFLLINLSKLEDTTTKMYK